MLDKAEFQNTGAGVVGVTTIEPGTGKHKGIAVSPGATVWLSEEEQIATANAPRRDADNPFVNGSLTLKTEPKQIANRRPIGHSDTAEQVPQTEEQKAAAEEATAKQREDADKARQAEEEQQEARRQRLAEQEEEAQKQATAGARPVDPTQHDVAPSGQPKPARSARPTQGGGGQQKAAPAKAKATA